VDGAGNPGGYRVVCDLSNNPGPVRAEGRMVVDIFLIPVSVAEFIHLNVAVTDAGVDLNMLVNN
jgi:phage tail sheath protein FI